MNCINTRSKDFKELERATKLSPFELERIIMVYQSQTGNDDFPSQEYIRAKSSRVIKSAIEKLEKNISDKQVIIDESNLEVNYIASISDDVNESTHIEKYIRESVFTAAKTHNIDVRFVHDTQSIDKLRFVNGKYIVNLSAINPKDNIDMIIAPLVLLNNTEAINPQMTSQRGSRTINELTIVDENGDIKTIDTEDLGALTIIHKNGTYRLVQKTADAEGILSDNSIDEKDLINNLSDHSYKILPNKQLASVLQSKMVGTNVIEFNQNIPGNLTLEEQHLEFLVNMLEQDRKGIFNVENDVVKSAALESTKSKINDLKLNTAKSFRDSVEVSDSVNVFSLQGLVFKTEVERDNFIETLEEIDPVTYVLAKKDPSTLSKQELKRLRAGLSSIHRNNVDRLKRKIRLSGNISDSTFAKTDLGMKLKNISKKLSIAQSTSRSKSNTRKISSIASSAVSNTEVYTILNKDIIDQTERLQNQINHTLSEIDKAIIDNDTNRIESLTADLTQELMLYKSVAGANYSSPLKGINSPATIKIYNQINKDMIVEIKSPKEITNDVNKSKVTPTSKKPDKERIKAVSELFESNPELADIGTQEQYSQYLDTIFPDSKVKDIVYHRSPNKFDKFDEKKIGSTTDAGYHGRGFYFSKDGNILKEYPNLYAILLDIKKLDNINTIKKATDHYTSLNENNLKGDGLLTKYETNWNGYTKEEIDEIIKNNPDSKYHAVKIKDDVYEVIREIPEEYVVYKEKQIHILGSKDDITDFNKYVYSDNQEESTTNKDEDGNDNMDEYDAYSVPTKYADERTNISNNVAKDHHDFLEKYGEEYSGIYGSLRGVNTYRNGRLRRNDIQTRIDAISKKLNAKIVLDENLPAKAALLSDYSQHVIQAKREGHTGPVIALNPDFLTSDSIFHEFGHLYIELLGDRDGIVNSAIQLLRGTNLYNKVREDYPELTVDELDKEVLATALGMEADMIFERSLQKLTMWQSIKRAIMDFLSGLFNMSNDAIEQLATEMLSDNKARIENANGYSSNITYFSKYKLDPSLNAQKEAARIFDELRNEVTIDEDSHKYSTNGETMLRSITAIAQSMAGKQKAGADKGSFNVEFKAEDYSKDSILYALTKPEIPAALAHALNNMVNSRIEGVIPTAMVLGQENWFDVYTREMSTENAVKETPEEKIAREKSRIENPSLYKSVRNDIVLNFDAIIKEAERLSKTYGSASIMGNILHKATENFIKEEVKNSPPGTIIDGKEFFDKVKAIYDEGVKNGSLFFSEQVLFDEDTKSPGTADLIEITKDGLFKIYDFKSVKSFKSKDGNDLSPNYLYYKKGYVHQLLSYGEILKKYGLKPHEDAYHILISEVGSADPDVIVESESDSIRLGNTRLVSLKNIPFYDSKFKQTQTSVTKYFKNKKVGRIDLKSQIENLEDATNQMYNVIKKFDSTLSSKAGDLEITLNTQNILKIFNENANKPAMKQYSEEVNFKYKRYISEKNKLVVDTFLDNIHRVMSEIKDTYNDGDAETSAQQLRSLNYILQVGESLADIRRGLTPQELRKNDTFTEEEAAEVEKKLVETMDAIKTNREFYKRKVIENAIHTLAMNSKQQEGFEIEMLEMKARRSGKTSKDEITKYVQENIKDSKDKLEAQELAYWTAKYESGILDLRTIESMFADPGMINSQIIQTAKQMMDSNDLYVRKLMMDYGPDIEKWHDDLELNGGNTRERWSKFITKSNVYIAETGKTEYIEDGGIVPEFISEFYTDVLKNDNDIANINYKKRALIDKDGMTAATVEKLEKYNEQIDEIKKRVGIKLAAMKTPQAKAKYYEAVVNPVFKALSKKDQEALRFLHKQLLDADGRIDNKAKRLTRTLKNNVVIYRLPRKRMSVHEIGLGTAASSFVSQVKDVWRPPTDEDTENIQEGELNPLDSGTAITDIKGNQVLDVPVYYRNQLEDPRLQSFDIPTLLLENHLTTLTYQQGTEMEADLFILKESLSSENNDKIMRTDNLMKQTMNDVTKNFSQKSEDNNLYKALASSIDQRLYKRAYSGVYSKGNYRLVKIMGSVGRYATINALTLNFKSMATTSLQGSIYRTIEGLAGEHFNMNDWKNGTIKTFAEFGDLIADTQRHVHKSKTNLLMKYFGLEQRSTALANKFVQDTFASRNLDSDSLYAVTSIAETTVTSMLMYSMLSNVKVMDKDQNYIDKDGKIVSDPKDAMSLDEAYEVKDGKLILNPKVVYTSKDFINKYVDNGSVDNDVASRIGSNMQNIYANMYGQYNEHLKSRVQRTAIGKMVMSMKGWLPRGLHNRFRGITTAIPFTESRLSFEDLRNPDAIDKRFFSQASKSFHEGYHSTMLRFTTDVVMNMKNGVNKLAFDSVYNNMTTHERANIKRSLIELALILSTFVAYKFLAALAKSYEEDDERASEYFYFVTYMTFRLNDELSTFISPFAMAEMIKNPAVAIGTVTNVSKLLSRLLGYDFDVEEGLDFNINDRYSSGPNKGKLKVTKDILRLTPGVNNGLQMLELGGVDVGGRTMKEQFNNQMMATK